MSQATDFGMMTAGPATAVQLAARLNPSFNALLSCHSGTSAPSYAVAGTVWLDTTSLTVDGASGINALKFYDGADWIPLIYVDPTNDRMWADQSFPEISIASAATVDALGAKSPRVFITGDDGPVSSLGDTPNRMVWTRLEMDNTFTHSAALKCPGDTDFAGKAGMRLLWASDSDGVPSLIAGMTANGHALVETSEFILPEGSAPSTPETGKVTLYAKSDGRLYGKDDAGTETPLSLVELISETEVSTAVAAVDFTLPDGYRSFRIELVGVKPSADAIPYVRFSQSGTFLSGSSDYADAAVVGGTTSTTGGFGTASSAQAGVVGQNVSWSKLLASGIGLFADMTLFSPGSYPTFIAHGLLMRSSGENVGFSSGGRLNANADPIDGVRLFFSATANISAGTIRLYGVK